jgi:hypothetical protein
VYEPDQASALLALVRRLKYMDRQEEALTAARDAVWMHRQHAKDCTYESRVGLAGSLSTLSHYLSKLGYVEDALAASTEAVKLSRELERQSPGGLSEGLSLSLHYLSVNLTNLGGMRRHWSPIKRQFRFAGNLQQIVRLHSIPTLQYLSTISRYFFPILTATNRLWHQLQSP